MAYSNQHFVPAGYMQPIAWDPMLEQQMVMHYSQANHHNPPEFYTTFDSSDASSQSSESSSLRSADNRKSIVSSNIGPSTKSPVPNRVERRREQNRQSQRAYRDRKEKHQRELEDQIAAWQAKHDKLVKSYAAQCEEVQRLKTRIQELCSQIQPQHLPSELDDVWSGIATISQSPTKIDFVSWEDEDDAWGRQVQ